MDMEITFPGGKKVDASFEDFTVRSDQAKSAGGEGSAPEPFSYFLASLGTCAGIYVLSFCQQRNLDTTGMKINFRSDWNRESKLVENITMEIVLPKDFPEKYKQAVVKSAELCTVKRHLATPPKFEITTTMV